MLGASSLRCSIFGINHFIGVGGLRICMIFKTQNLGGHANPAMAVHLKAGPGIAART
jgi:hypothetical protein